MLLKMKHEQIANSRGWQGLEVFIHNDLGGQIENICCNLQLCKKSFTDLELPEVAYWFILCNVSEDSVASGTYSSYFYEKYGDIFFKSLIIKST